MSTRATKRPAAKSLVLASSFSFSAFAADVSGCKDSDYVTASGPTVAIHTRGANYSPKCVKVLVDTEVTIDGSSFHPLQAQDAIAGATHPFQIAGRGSTSAVTRKLTQSGTYGYFCENHGDAAGNGMAGAIRVVDASSASLDSSNE